MKEKTKNMLIGLFIFVACFLIVSIILFLKPTVGDGKKTLYVRFSNINKIGIGTRVLFAGKPIGEVVSVEEISNAREQPSDALGQVYFYQLTLKIDSSVKVYNTDEIALQTSGLLGEKSISISPKSPPVGITPKLISSEPIYASSIDPIENTFDEISDLANKVNASVDHFSKWMQDNSDEISYAIKKFGETMHEINIVVAAVNEHKLVPALKNTVDHLDETVVKISDKINKLHHDGVFDNLAVTMDNAKNVSVSLDSVTKNLSNGSGTLGKLIYGNDMYLEFNAILSKVDTLMNDVNHYGVLFHLNKNWQRTRTKKMTILDSLESPSDFRSYFSKEVDGINTAMSRLSILIDRAESSEKNQNVLQSQEFKKDFATLMRQIETLSDTIKLYNEKLQEEQ